MKAWRAKVYGVVQNVGFRASVKKIANQEGLVGTVRNVADGGVEIVLIGEKSELEKLIQSLKKDACPWQIDRVVYESCNSDHIHQTFEIVR